MSRLIYPAGRIAAGTAVVARRLTARATAWVARGRRDDLKGWRAALGCVLRLLALGLGLYLLWRLVRAVPALMWLLTASWTIAAWRAVEAVPTAAAQPPVKHEPGHAPEDVRAATLEWVQQRIGDAQGVHLRDLLAHAQAHGMFEGLDVSALKGHLERWGIPVRSRVRVRGLGVTVGVHRDDLKPLLQASPESSAQEPPNPGLHAA
ncbi:hypothetical protein [Streptomyces sp. NPDC004008]